MRAPTPPQAQTAPSAPGAALPASPGIPAPSADFLALQAQAADLSTQLAGLRIQQRAISRQIDRATGGEREALIQQRTPVDVQVAQKEVQLDNVRAQIAARSHVPMDRVTTSGQVVIMPPRYRDRSPDPGMIIGMTFTLLLVVVIPMSIAYARRIWRGTPKPTVAQRDDLSPRFDRLEQAVDAIAIEIERISEGQRFMTKVMAERPVERPERSGLDGGSARAESAPILALGAGPAEPIATPKRQSVRQSITPH